jgi:hypothetical protein
MVYVQTNLTANISGIYRTALASPFWSKYLLISGTFPLKPYPKFFFTRVLQAGAPPSHWLTMGHHLVRMIAQFSSWASHCTLHMHSPVGSTNTDDRSPQPTQSCSDLTSVGAIQMANSCMDLIRINH